MIRKAAEIRINFTGVSFPGKFHSFSSFTYTLAIGSISGNNIELLNHLRGSIVIQIPMGLLLEDDLAVYFHDQVTCCSRRIGLHISLGENMFNDLFG